MLSRVHLSIPILPLESLPMCRDAHGKANDDRGFLFGGKMKKIPLTQGKFALVDDEDFEMVNRFKWYAVKGRHTFYAIHGIPTVDGKHRQIKMHRLLLNTPLGMHTDHKNGNGLDNRRGNIRTCTPCENKRNSRKQINNTTGFKGVCIHHGKYIVAAIKHRGRRIHLGTFSSIRSAARAYDVAAQKLHGEFARLNFPIHKSE